jgi:hypothetical protein
VKDQIIVRDAGTTYILDGREVGEKEYRARYPLPSSGAGTFATPAPGAYRNFFSDALAVHPERIPDAVKAANDRGVPTEFEPQFGRPQFRDSGHRRRYLKAFGYHDRNSFNGY